MKKICMLVLGLIGIAVPAVKAENYGIDISWAKDQFWCNHQMLVDETVVTFVGIDSDFTTRNVVNQLALTTEGTMDIFFSPPVAEVNAYLTSNPGSENDPPIVTCYGYYLPYDNFMGSVYQYKFGPGQWYDSFPSTSQSASGTPNNEEARFQRCTITNGTIWKISIYPGYEEEERGTPHKSANRKMSIDRAPIEVIFSSEADAEKAIRKSEK